MYIEVVRISGWDRRQTECFVPRGGRLLLPTSSIIPELNQEAIFWCAGIRTFGLMRTSKARMPLALYHTRRARHNERCGSAYVGGFAWLDEYCMSFASVD